MEFYQGQRVYVEGDPLEICTADYTARVASMAMVTEDTDPRDDYVRLLIDKIGRDRDAVVYCLKSSVRSVALQEATPAPVEVVMVTKAGGQLALF